ncbi:MAG: alanine racemase [Trueperaceae bacterium]
MQTATRRFVTRLDVDTPALVVDLDVMDTNIERMAKMAAAHGVQLRPHIKTHKSPWIARRQIEAGAVGVTVAKLGEAEAMASGGIEDILIAFPLVGESKLRRLEQLMKRVPRVAVSLDDLRVAEGLAEVGRRLGRPVPVYLEIDTGLGRVGVASGGPALELAKAVADLEGVQIAAVMTHGGHVGAETTPEALERASRQQAQALVAVAEEIRSNGIEVPVVSPGSTLAAPYEADTPGVTEIRPGTYVFNDSNTIARFQAAPEDCAAYIIATVVSRPVPERAVVDAGSKSFGADAKVDRSGEPGLVVDRNDARLVRASEEHGVLELDPSSDLAIGDRVAIVMNHVCPVVNLYDTLIGVRDGRVEREIPVEARGRRT